MWPTTIRYVITSEFDSYPNTQALIVAALRHWEEETCLDFVEGYNLNEPHIRFVRQTGCWSFVGKTGGGQKISIGEGCESKGTIAHEIGHALGFSHEQARPDRDDFVTINEENIKSGRLRNFLRKSWSDVLTLGVPYDYSSVMHYGSHSFSANGLQTISTKEEDMSKTIGSRVKLSFYDVKIANLRYCSSRCIDGLTWSSCRNDGYKDPKNCNKCKCPDGWTGTYCTDVANGNCGSPNIKAYLEWNYLSYTSASPAVVECTWKIRAVYSTQVEIEFVDTFEFESFCPSTCKNFVEVRFQNLAKTGPRFCCEKPTKVFRSNGDELMILLRINAGSGQRKFKIRYRESCGGDLSSSVLSDQPCMYLRPSSCRTVDFTKCGFWGLYACSRYGLKPCDKYVSECNQGFKFNEGKCHREWTEWSSWSSCSRSCGGCGTQTRTRTCLIESCSDADIETRGCNDQFCPATKVASICRGTAPCGFLWLFACTRYYTCYRISRCCVGWIEGGNTCFYHKS